MITGWDPRGINQTTFVVSWLCAMHTYNNAISGQNLLVAFLLSLRPIHLSMARSSMLDLKLEEISRTKMILIASLRVFRQPTVFPQALSKNA